MGPLFSLFREIPSTPTLCTAGASRVGCVDKVDTVSSWATTPMFTSVSEWEGRGEARAFDIYTDKALSRGEAGSFWNGVSSSSYISEQGRLYPAKGRTEAQEENVRKALLALWWGISSQGQKHENMKFHSKVFQPPHFANFLTLRALPVCCLHTKSTGPLVLAILCPMAFWTWWLCYVVVLPVTGFLRTKYPPFPWL